MSVSPAGMELAAPQQEVPLQPVDASQQLVELRLRGAQRLEPVRFHYLETLAQRAQTQPPKVRRILEDRLVLALEAWQQRLAQAQQDRDGGVPPPAPTRADVQPGLRGLLAYLAEQTPQAAPDAAGAIAGLAGEAGARTELKSVRNSRNTWSKLSADRQLAQALNQAPRNAGPINSHMLVLRSLALMREISPDYLNRFMTYADTLLALEHSDRAQAAAMRTETKGADARKAKPGRSR